MLENFKLEIFKKNNFVLFQGFIYFYLKLSSPTPPSSAQKKIEYIFLPQVTPQNV